MLLPTVGTAPHRPHGQADAEVNTAEAKEGSEAGLPQGRPGEDAQPRAAATYAASVDSQKAARQPVRYDQSKEYRVVTQWVGPDNAEATLPGTTEWDITVISHTTGVSRSAESSDSLLAGASEI